MNKIFFTFKKIQIKVARSLNTAFKNCTLEKKLIAINRDQIQNMKIVFLYILHELDSIVARNVIRRLALVWYTSKIFSIGIK